MDPKNPDSYSKSIVLVEAFVNVAHPSPYNGYVLEALKEIDENDSDNVIVVEYHRDLTQNGFYDDPYNDEELSLRFTQLQERYLQEWPDAIRGVPDVYINGGNRRVAGASSKSSVLNRMQLYLDEVTDIQNRYSIEVDLQYPGQDQIDIKARVASLGNQASVDLRLRFMFVKDHQTSQASRAVNYLEDGVLVGKIDAGSYKEIRLATINFDTMPDYAVISLTSDDGSEVYQTLQKTVE